MTWIYYLCTRKSSHQTGSKNTDSSRSHSLVAYSVTALLRIVQDLQIVTVLGRPTWKDAPCALPRLGVGREREVATEQLVVRVSRDELLQKQKAGTSYVSQDTSTCVQHKFTLPIASGKVFAHQTQAAATHLPFG